MIMPLLEQVKVFPLAIALTRLCRRARLYHVLKRPIFFYGGEFLKEI
jgi:hypothetical protein